MMTSRVVLNVSGEVYETWESTLKRYPRTLLGNNGKRCHYYCTASGQFYFNRNRTCFGSILFFYQSRGILRCPPGIPLEVFEEECIFFQIPENYVSELRNSDCLLFPAEDEEGACAEDLPPLTMKEKCWNILENPETGQFPQNFAIFSISMICGSVLVSCLSSVKSLVPQNVLVLENPWAVAELSLNVWFLTELTMRILFTPCVKTFLLSTMNWVDIIAIIPYFLVFITSRELVTSLGYLKIMRFIRIVRLFRLSKHSKRLQVVGAIIKSSLGDLQLLMLCLAMVIVFGGSLMYFIEGYKGVETGQFSSIPESLWWGIQTITTLGYGDIHPATPPGRLLAACFMAFGALTISLPVLSIVTKFTVMYAQNIEGYV